jgi:hypothetical protein
MAVRSDRLAGPVLLAAGSSTTLFTVPAAQTWLVKRVTAFNQGAVPTTVFWFVSLGGIDSSFWTPVPASLRADDHETWLALDPGCELHVSTTTTDISLMVFGSKLIGVA